MFGNVPFCVAGRAGQAADWSSASSCKEERPHVQMETTSITNLVPGLTTLLKRRFPFPSFLLGTKGLIALRAVLPDLMPVFAVGGVAASNFTDWRKAGALGFGIGTALYAPGCKLSDIKKSANEIVKSYDELDPW